MKKILILTLTLFLSGCTLIFSEEDTKPIEQISYNEKSELRTFADLYELPFDNTNVVDNVVLEDNNELYLITFNSTDESILSNEGIVNRTQLDQIVTLEVTFSHINEETVSSDTQTDDDIDYSEIQKREYFVKVTGTVTSSSTDIFISEVVEGSSYNKAVEIYNNTNINVDLSTYELHVYKNGSATSVVVNLYGTLNSNSECVIYNETKFTLNIDNTINKCGDLDTSAEFNGDDEVFLYNNINSSLTLVDQFGHQDNIENKEMFNLDVTFVRKSFIKDPNNTFTLSEWEILDKDVHSLGNHNVISLLTDLNITEDVIDIAGRSDISNYDITSNIENYIDGLLCLDKLNNVDTTYLGNVNNSLYCTDGLSYKVINFTINVVSGIPLSAAALAYYSGFDFNVSDEDLRTSLNALISDHVVFPYTASSTDVWDILREADEDPKNPNNVILIYTGESLSKDCQDTSNPPAHCDGKEWNREHIWSKSRGPFEEPEMTPYTDTHHLVAADRTMNSTKNNRYYSDCNDGDDTNVVARDFGNFTCNEWNFEPRDEIKGDVARMIFYMALRYEGLNGELDLEIEISPDADKSLKLPVYGDLNDLIKWHQEDPVSQKEMDRNDIIESYQTNRNPFIDFPEIVSRLY